MFEAKVNNPKCSVKINFTAYSVWTIGFLCIFASIQTVTIASPIHLSIAHDEAVVNIEIKHKVAVNISIGLGSTEDSNETSGDKIMDCKWRGSPAKQLESTRQIETTNEIEAATEEMEATTEETEATTEEMEATTEEMETTEEIETTTAIISPKELIMLTILQDDETETKRLLTKFYGDLNGNREFLPITYAAQQCKTNVAKMLIENGADVNIVGGGEWRPIHVAAYNGCLDIVDELIKSGANLNAKIGIGYTALDIAKQEGHREISSLITRSLAGTTTTEEPTTTEETTTSEEPATSPDYSDLCELYGLGCATEESVKDSEESVKEPEEEWMKQSEEENEYDW